MTNTATVGKAYELRITGSGKRFSSALAKVRKTDGAHYAPESRTWTVTAVPSNGYQIQALIEGGWDVEVTEA